MVKLIKKKMKKYNFTILKMYNWDINYYTVVLHFNTPCMEINYDAESILISSPKQNHVFLDRDLGLVCLSIRILTSVIQIERTSYKWNNWFI